MAMVVAMTGAMTGAMAEQSRRGEGSKGWKHGGEHVTTTGHTSLHRSSAAPTEYSYASQDIL